MTNRVALKKLQDMMEHGGEIDEECYLVDLLDYLATIGINDARKFYIAALRRRE